MPGEDLLRDWIINHTANITSLSYDLLIGEYSEKKHALEELLREIEIEKTKEQISFDTGLYNGSREQFSKSQTDFFSRQGEICRDIVKIDGEIAKLKEYHKSFLKENIKKLDNNAKKYNEKKRGDT